MQMFGRSNQYATVSGFGVRVKDEREKDRNHLIETNFEVPLTHELADQILPAMARDLFQEVSGDWTPKPEMDTAGFNLAPEVQVMTVREHPEGKPLFKAEGVNIRKVQAKKAAGGTWVLGFTCTWVMTESVQAVAIIHHLKSGVYLTYEVQAPRLELGPAPDEDAGQVAKVDQGGNVTSLADAKKKKKKRTAGPEAEAAAQVQEGRKKKGADEDPGPGDGEETKH